MDMISDDIFHMDFPNKWKFLSELWTIPLDSIPHKVFEARLVALNKVHPQIPKPGEFRPIVVMSPIAKFMEARFFQKLMRYCKEDLAPSQIGFVEGYGCETNLKRLVVRGKELRSYSLIRWCILFFDFKSAYNTVNRQKLYHILRTKEILKEEETEWLKDFHDRIRITSGRQSIFPENGLHQGSMISPLLFNIYAEPIVEALQDTLQIVFYVDDLE